MIRLAIRFPSGRFHATPWDRHVNEGVPEWPPAPWRLLRALAAALHDRCPELDRTVAWRALRRLSMPPLFSLPEASVGHTRHYLSRNALKRSDTALTFDTFIAVPRDRAVVVHWRAELDGAERRALAAMARQVSYLGRAESWCELEVLPEDAAAAEPNCWPSDGTAAPRQDTLRILCPADEFTEEQLLHTTAELQRKGWSDPPGTRWVFYRRRADALTPRAGGGAPARQGARPQIAEFALGGTVLPLITDGIRVAELLRRAAMALHRQPSATLSGKDAQGRPLRGRHQHAHYLPEARGPDPRRVTHVLVYAPAGYTASEQEALARIRFLPRALIEEGGARHGAEGVAARTSRPARRPDAMDVEVVLCGFGTEAEARASGGEGASRLFGEADVWRSRTPFVLPRHVKRNRDSPEEQVRRELALRGLPCDEREVNVRPLTGPATGGFWTDYRTRRWGDDHRTAICGFELRFVRSQQGPILLGYGSHYGLGQFEPVPKEALLTEQRAGLAELQRRPDRLGPAAGGADGPG